MNSGQAAVWSWSGGGGANANWNNSANWGFAGIPSSGDTVVFPASQPNLLNTNNIAGLVLNQIRFAGATGGYDIRGNALTLTNSIVVTNTTGGNTIENNITLATASALIVVSNGVSLTLDGSLSGSVGVSKTGLGTLLYQCPYSDNSGNNSYTGTTLVAGGTLQLNCGGYNAISGPLVIGDGTGANSPTVQYLQGDEMKYLSSVTINQIGLLDLNNFNEDFFTTNLTLNGSTISSGNGTVTLPANSTINVPANGFAAVIEGKLNNGSGTLTLQGNNNLYIYASVSGTANIVQTNIATFWYGANNYIGNYTANGNGFVVLASSQALGNSANNLTMNGTTSIDIYSQVSLTNQSLTMNSTNNSFQIAVYGSSTNSIWQAHFTNNIGLAIDLATNCALTLVGPISGLGGLTELDSGTLTLSGTNNNSYAGTTTVSGGTLLLGKTDFAIAVPSPLVIGSNTTVRLLDDFQIGSYTTSVTMNDASVLDLNGFTELLGPLSLQGAQIMGNGGFMYLSANITVNASAVAQSVISGVAQIYGSILTITNVGHNYSPDLIISANLGGGGVTNGLILTGAGEVSLAGNNTFTGPVTVNGGSLWARTSTALGNTNAPATINSGGSLFLDGTGLDFGLKPLMLNGSGDSFGALTCLGSSSWQGPITLASDSTIYQFAASSLTLNGSISGPGSYIKSGPGINTFAGSGFNPYLGQTFVNDGILNLSKTGYSIGTGALNIGDGVGALSSAVVRNFSNNQIISSVIIHWDGLLDLNGHNELIGPAVTMDGYIAITNTGTGTLTLANGTTLTSKNDACYILGGYLNIGSTNTTCNWMVTSGNGLGVSSSVIGAATLALTGYGWADLESSNSYTGPTLIQQGALYIENNHALGATNNGVVVGPDAALILFVYGGGNLNITNKLLTLNGPGLFGEGGRLNIASGTNVWAGPVIVNGNSMIDIYGPEVELHISGPISGPGGFELIGGGTQYFEGATANTYAGVTRVDSDINGITTLVLNKTPGQTAVGNLDIFGLVRLANADQTRQTSDVNVENGGLFNFSSFYSYLDTLHGLGTVNFGFGAWLELGMNNGSSEFDGPFTGIGYSSGWTVGKTGTGTFTIGGNSTYTAGITHVLAGKAVINGSQPLIPVTVDSTASLAGTGTVGTITANGSIAPGNSIGSGMLNSSNVTFSATGKFTVGLNGTNTGISYSQLNVTGAVSLASANLQLVAGGVGAVNSHYTIINNDSLDPEVGIFNGLPEGATLTGNNGTKYTISYHGGSGNDVVLTQISLPTPPQLNGIQSLAGGFIQLDGLGLTNLTYTVWANTNLATTNWIFIGSAAPPANTNAFQFTDQNATNFTQRFYRFSWP